MHDKMVRVRLTSRPHEDVEVSAREALSLRAQGLLVPLKSKAAAAAPARGATQ